MRHITIIPRGQSLGSTWSLPKDDSSNLTRNEMYEQIISLLGGRVAEALFIGDISVGASNDIERATKLAKDMVARYGMSEKLGTVSYLDDGEVFIGRDYQTTKSYSEQVAGTIDQEVKALIDRAYAHCKKILSENSEKLGTVSYLDGGEVFIGRDYQTTKSYSEKVAGTIDDEVKALIDRAYAHCKNILTENADKLNAVVDFLMEHESMTGEQFVAIMEGKPVGDASNTAMFDGFEEPEKTEEAE